MNYIQKELLKYLDLTEGELDSFTLVLKKKGFLEADNSLQILLAMFEASYSKGRTDLLKQLSEAIKDNEEEV